jgi:hypothetical protein
MGKEGEKGVVRLEGNETLEFSFATLFVLLQPKLKPTTLVNSKVEFHPKWGDLV